MPGYHSFLNPPLASPPHSPSLFNTDHNPTTATLSFTSQHSNKLSERESVVPKPKYLQQLEYHLQRELKFLNCPPQGPDKTRLQVLVLDFIILYACLKSHFYSYSRPTEKCLSIWWQISGLIVHFSLQSRTTMHELIIEHQEETIRGLLPIKDSSCYRCNV